MKLRTYVIVAAGVLTTASLILVWNTTHNQHRNSSDTSKYRTTETISADKQPPSTEHSMPQATAGTAKESPKPTQAPLGTYEVPQGPVVAVYDRLKARADEGDALASFGIYQKLRQCRQLLSRGIEDGVASAFEKAGLGDEYLKGVERQAQDCQGASTLLNTQQPGAWLERAADQGALIAQLMYAADQGEVLGTPQDMINNPEKLIRYKKKAMGFLRSAAESGSSDAMFNLANAYTQGFFAEKSPERAYAYAYAGALLSNSPAANQLRDQYAIDLSTEQIERGRIEGKRMFDHCCKVVR